MKRLSASQGDKDGRAIHARRAGVCVPTVKLLELATEALVTLLEVDALERLGMLES